MRLIQRRRWGEPVPPREAIVFPVRPLEYRSYEPLDDSASHPARRAAKEDRKYTPYQKGDIFFINTGFHVITIARVVMCFQHYQERRGYYIPKWRIQLATKDGHWSAQWRYCFPGDVFRAYFMDDNHETPRKLPEEIDASWLKQR